MSDRVLVTGGAGFIGSHIVDLLVEEGYDVKVFDNFEYQVHNGNIPDYLNPGAEYIVGDVRNEEQLRRALDGVDTVCHQAAAVGIAQSMYQISKYTDVNTGGTATLLEIISQDDGLDVGKIVLASSFSNYGEGAYECTDCGIVYPGERPRERLEDGKWEHVCPSCGEEVSPVPTTEDAPLSASSVYAETKRSQEETARIVGRNHGIDVAALRYFNVLGPRQSLDNPYTGVASIFSSRIKNGNPPVLYEDGEQTRDFVFVKDVARANLLAIQSDVSDAILNIGSGEATSVRTLSETLIDSYGADLASDTPGTYRKGDIRHCYADLTRAEREIGYEPQFTFSQGIQQLVDWAEERDASDRFDEAASELDEEDLVGGS